MLKRLAHISWWVYALVLAILIAGVMIYFQYRASVASANRYSTYEALAVQQEQAAYLVGSADNPVRQELNQVLSATLAKTMTAPDRLKLATHGHDLLKQSESQIDTIGDIGAKVDTAIAQMQIGTVGQFSSSDTAREVMILAKKRASIIADIRGLSYRANFETAQIFDRIIADGGKLTPAHITDINNEIPSVEEQFNKRSSLYTQLQSTSAEIDQRSHDIGGFFSKSWKGGW